MRFIIQVAIAALAIWLLIDAMGAGVDVYRKAIETRADAIEQAINTNAGIR